MENIEIVDFNDYVVKTYKKEVDGKEKYYFILSKSYYSQAEKKYIESGSIFIDKKFAKALVKTLGVRCFDNAKVFEKLPF